MILFPPKSAAISFFTLFPQRGVCVDGLMLTSRKKNALKLCQRAYWAGAGDLTDFPRNLSSPWHTANTPTIHQPPSPEQHRRRCNHPLCMEQHAQRRRWWSHFSPPLLLPALISEEVDVVDQTAVGCVGRSEDGLPSVLWSVSHPKQEIGLYY